MIVRSRAPLRLGLAGGGTDVSPYSDEFGGCVLNVTVSMYAHCTIELGDHLESVVFSANDIGVEYQVPLNDVENIGISGELTLHKAIYLRIVEQFCGGIAFPVRVTTYCDAPPGSGLGSSSTVVVSIIEAFKTALNLPLGEYDIAQLAFEIERVDCNLAGGKQDQYAATFGGFNFMEFYHDNRVVVNPLRIRSSIVNELEESIVLFFTGASRDSAKIISDQMNSISRSSSNSLEAMHNVKKSAYKIKEYLLKGDLASLFYEFKSSWEAKKRTSGSISNPLIERVEKAVLLEGARSLKVSGAGGGGFMMIFVEPEKRPRIEDILNQMGGNICRVHFTNEGASSWKIEST